MRIVVAVDGSPRSARAIDYLARHRVLFADDAPPVLVHVCPRVPSHAARHLPRSAVARYYEEEAAKAIGPAEAALARHGLAGWKVERRHGRGAEQILASANENAADLIVLGLRDMLLFGRPLPGSVAAQLAATSRQIAVLRVP
jgi:nucleotide-binding universal stress UspA family protein